jgi:hypothetical protein
VLGLLLAAAIGMTQPVGLIVLIAAAYVAQLVRSLAATQSSRPVQLRETAAAIELRPEVEAKSSIVKSSLLACGQNRFDEIARYFVWHWRRGFLEGLLPQFHRFCVAPEIVLTVDAEPKVLLEEVTRVARELARKVIHHEVGEFTAGHWDSFGNGVGDCSRQRF